MIPKDSSDIHRFCNSHVHIVGLKGFETKQSFQINSDSRKYFTLEVNPDSNPTNLANVYFTSNLWLLYSLDQMKW